MKVHGSCHCGAIRFEADADPAKAGVCHCTDCQSLTGSAFALSDDEQPRSNDVLTASTIHPLRATRPALSGRGVIQLQRNEAMGLTASVQR